MSIEQGTQEWREDRAGRITASRFIDVIAVRRDGKPTEGRTKYMQQLVFERLADAPKREVSSKSMAWGKEVEDFAREAYELRTGNIVAKSGFITHPRYPFIGASPDGLVDTIGGIEMKCPHDEAVHVATWLSGMPADHMPQVQGSMWVTGRQWWDFISYDPRQAERFRLYIERIQRDEKYIADLAGALLQFQAEAVAMQAELEAKAETV